MPYATLKPDTQSPQPNLPRRQDYHLSIHDGIWICTFALCQFGDDLGHLAYPQAPPFGGVFWDDGVMRVLG